VLIDVSDRQLHKDFQDIETFSRLYHQLYQHYMQSFIHFVLWLNLDISSFLIISDKYWGIPNECTLYSSTNLLPGLLFVVEFESHYKKDHFVNVYTNVPLLF